MASDRRKKIKLAKWRRRHPGKWWRQQAEAVRLICALSIDEIERDLEGMVEGMKDGGFCGFAKQIISKWPTSNDIIIYATYTKDGLVVHDD